MKTQDQAPNQPSKVMNTLRYWFAKENPLPIEVKRYGNFCRVKCPLMPQFSGIGDTALDAVMNWRERSECQDMYLNVRFVKQFSTFLQL